jgi:tetratricopeptide (TPR) repeat protein
VKTDDKHYYMSRPIITVLNGIESCLTIITMHSLLTPLFFGRITDSFLESAPEQALNMYQQVIELYPESAYACSALAAAYKITGKLKQAIALQTLAVENSASMIEWHQNKLNKLLSEYKEHYGLSVTDSK